MKLEEHKIAMRIGYKQREVDTSLSLGVLDVEREVGG